MGNCCAADADKDKEVSMQKDYKGRQHAELTINQLSQQTGYQKKDILGVILRIQSIWRGALTRKKIRQVYGFQATRYDPMYFSQQPNYDNPIVQDIKGRLGVFNYNPAP